MQKLFSFSLFVIATLAVGCSRPAASASPERIKRGEYLVSVIGCADCHTPWTMGANGPEPDLTRHLSGHPEQMGLPSSAQQEPWAWAGAATNTAFVGPWGVSYTANLTPASTARRSCARSTDDAHPRATKLVTLSNHASQRIDPPCCIRRDRFHAGTAPARLSLR